MFLLGRVEVQTRTEGLELFAVSMSIMKGCACFLYLKEKGM